LSNRPRHTSLVRVNSLSAKTGAVAELKSATNCQGLLKVTPNAFTLTRKTTYRSQDTRALTRSKVKRFQLARFWYTISISPCPSTHRKPLTRKTPLLWRSLNSEPRKAEPPELKNYQQPHALKLHASRRKRGGQKRNNLSWEIPIMRTYFAYGSNLNERRFKNRISSVKFKTLATMTSHSVNLA
jgi:hypothetical protein